jgi:hypothetical protein
MAKSRPSDGSIRFVQYFERSILQYVLPEDGGPAMYSDLIGYSATAPDLPRAGRPVPVIERSLVLPAEPAFAQLRVQAGVDRLR